MKSLSRMFNTLPKRLATGALVALAIILPVAATAADMVKIEADTTVANATKNAGTMQWGSSTTASYNEVVAVQVVYNNDEAADSGKTANNLRVKINIPNTPGTSQTITTKTSADNSNVVNGSSKVTLDRDDAYLQYIPGTATWKHADTANGPMTVTQKVSDDVVMNADGLVLENENPCQAGSIVVQARVMVPGVQVQKQVRVDKEGTKYATSNTANPGDTLLYRIIYTNNGNTTQTHVTIRDELPKGMTLVPGSTILTNSDYKDGVATKTDGIVGGGIDIGTYDPGINAYVVFKVKVPAASALACGENKFVNFGFVHPENMLEYYNSATTTVNKECQPNQPKYSCDLLDVTKGANRTVTVNNFKYTATNGASFKNVVLSWGDSSASLTTNKPVSQSHQYAKDGTYTVTATAHFTVNDQDKSDQGNCSKTVSFTTPTTPTTPTTLVNTGPGEVLGVFAAVTAAGAIAHRWFLVRRFAR